MESDTTVFPRGNVFLCMDVELNHSVENIYSQAGQYDHYTVLDFYFKSPSYLTYGSHVHGLLLYMPSERAILEEAIQPGNNSNHDGIIRMNSNLKDEELHKRLATEGVPASDIRRVSVVNAGNNKKAYKGIGVKQIPNTINVKFKSTKDGPYTLALLNFKHRIEAGLPLIPSEELKYQTLRFLIDGELELYKQHLVDPNTNRAYNEALIIIGGYAYNAMDDKRPVIKTMFNDALKQRRIERTSYIKKHFGVSDRHLEQFKEENPEAWKELMRYVLAFDSEVIEVWEWKYPVWWDFERLSHIYLRHYSNFFIKGSSKGQGATFQYLVKDIRRLIGIVLKANQADIESHLSANKPYDKYGEQGYYYNGNFYEFRIDATGRLMTFYPQDTYNSQQQ
jgi:hypothetical protein